MNLDIRLGVEGGGERIHRATLAPNRRVANLLQGVVEAAGQVAAEQE